MTIIDLVLMGMLAATACILAAFLYGVNNRPRGESICYWAAVTVVVISVGAFFHSCNSF